MKNIQVAQIRGQSEDEMVDPNETDEAVASRLRLLRRVMKPDANMKQYAEVFLKVSYTRYFNAENGSPLGRDLASLIRKKIPGITTDWLYYGDTCGVHLELLQALTEAAAEDGENGTTGAAG